MTYRITSNEINRNFWFVAIPKCGTQSLRQLIDNNLHSKVILHNSNQWHMDADQIVNSSNFNTDTDSLFALVRNPWDRFVSYYEYEREKLVDKLTAYDKGQAGLKEYAEANPQIKVHDYNDLVWKKLKKAYSIFATFETFILSFHNSSPWIPVDNIDILDDWMLGKRALIRLNKFKFHMIFQSECIITSHSDTILTFPLEEEELILYFLDNYFDCEENLKMPYINVNKYRHKDYRDLYSKKMRSIVSDVEHNLILRHGYKF